MAGNLKEPRDRFLTLQTDLQRLGILLLPPAAPPAAPIALEPVATTIPTTLAPPPAAPPAAPRAAPTLVPLPIQQAPVTHLEETLEKKHEETPEDTPEDNPESTPEFDGLNFDEDPLTTTYLARWKSPDCGDDESSVSSLSTKTTDAITAKSHNEMMIKAKFKCSIDGHLISLKDLTDIDHLKIRKLSELKGICTNVYFLQDLLKRPDLTLPTKKSGEDYKRFLEEIQKRISDNIAILTAIRTEARNHEDVQSLSELRKNGNPDYHQGSLPEAFLDAYINGSSNNVTGIVDSIDAMEIDDCDVLIRHNDPQGKDKDPLFGRGWRFKEWEEQNPEKKRKNVKKDDKRKKPRARRCRNESDDEEEIYHVGPRQPNPTRTDRRKNNELKNAIQTGRIQELQKVLATYVTLGVSDFSKPLWCNGDCPFIFAVGSGCLEMVKFVATRTENPFSLQTDKGETALMRSLSLKKKDFYYARGVVEYLLENSQVTIYDDSSNSALTLAAQNVHCDPAMFDLILQKCESSLSHDHDKLNNFLTKTNANGYSPLMLACRSKIKDKTPSGREAFERKMEMLIARGVPEIPQEAQDTLEHEFWPEYKKLRDVQEERALVEQMQNQQLSEYELQRRERIAQNQAKLKSLGFN